MGLTTFGPVEDKVRAQMTRCQEAEDGAPAVLCADNHLGYSMPIGGVIAYEGFISPSAVGYDIGCGNAAVKTEIPASSLSREKVMDDLWNMLSFGMGRKNAEKVEAPVLDTIAASPLKIQRDLAKMAQDQLGTIGSGNHYVDLFEDADDGFLWIGVHFGSRGFGHKTATWALEAAGRKNDAMDAPPVVLPIRSSLGAEYLEGMKLAGEYAYVGRDWVINRILRYFGAHGVDYVHNHHNFAWKENHDGKDYWVHRKGATPAFPGQRGFVGGTMGEDAVILSGLESVRSASALYSTVHGAGRAMSRTQAAGKSKRFKVWTCGQRACGHHAPEQGFPANAFRRGREGSLPPCPADGCTGKLGLRTVERVLSQGVIDFPAVQRDLAAAGIVLRGAGADEAPAAYKRLPEVLAYHDGTIQIQHTLHPIGVAMAGRDVEDPFRD